MSTEKYYLAWRDQNGLRKIEVYGDQNEALSKYSFAEHVCMFGDTRGLDCCLFGSDSLATLCKTHSSWFCPEALDISPTKHSRPYSGTHHGD